MSNVSIFKQGAVTTTGARELSDLARSFSTASLTRRIQTNTNGTFKRIVNGEQIGNAVPPLAGRAIGLAIKAYLNNCAASEARPKFKESERNKAIKKLEELTNSLYLGVIKNMSTKEFLAAWNLVHLVHPTLHPETALDRSGEIHMPPSRTSDILGPYYKRSGWPVALIPIAIEANNRYIGKEFTEEDYYFNNLASA
jgi:DNA (cytosine-5)-methyltransferase 1